MLRISVELGLVAELVNCTFGFHDFLISAQLLRAVCSS